MEDNSRLIQLIEEQNSKLDELIDLLDDLGYSALAIKKALDQLLPVNKNNDSQKDGELQDGKNDESQKDDDGNQDEAKVEEEVIS